MDKNGYLFITGRNSRNIKLFGHRVNLDEIERALQKKGHNFVCLGKDNKVTIFSKKNENQKEIIKFLSKLMSIHSSCFNLKYIKSFPLSPNNKISYKELEKFI